jgi:hypothetical protein
VGVRIHTGEDISEADDDCRKYDVVAMIWQKCDQD